MSNDSIIDYWHKLHSTQSAWALRAYERLIDTLSEDVKEKLSLNKDDKAEPYVVIFGNTQVGKTTLLLDLIGIAPEHMGVVSDVMRGGRDHGKSATATAMEYCRSTDGRWGLTKPPAETLWFNSDSNEEITNALIELREEMESGHLAISPPCQVHIPKKFFGATYATAPRVRILDLPGDKSAEEKEQKHVHKMAETYLRFADLILLVGKGDHLGFLHPENITLPGIKNWQIMPRNFRIITTFSYTPQSTIDYLRKNPQPTVEQLRKRLIEQIGSLSEEASGIELYFPLEFGSSWMGLQKSDPDLHQKISKIIKQLRSELLEQISQATSPMGRVRHIRDTYLHVKDINKKKIERIENQLEENKEKKNKIQEDLKLWDSLIQDEEKKLLKLESILNNTHNIFHLIKESLNNPTINHYPPQPGSHENRKTLQELIYNYYQVLKNFHLDVKLNSTKNTSPIHSDTDYTKPSPLQIYFTQINRRKINPDINTIQTILDNAFTSIRITLDSYLIDKYWSSKNYKTDKNHVQTAGTQAKNNLIKQWGQSWLTAANIVYKEYQDEKNKIKNNITRNCEEQRKIHHSLEEIKSEKIKLCTDLKENMRLAQKDQERCDHFAHLLNEEYFTSLSKKINEFYEAKDDCDALLLLFSLIELKNQHEDIVKLNENKYGQIS